MLIFALSFSNYVVITSLFIEHIISATTNHFIDPWIQTLLTFQQTILINLLLFITIE